MEKIKALLSVILAAIMSLSSSASSAQTSTKSKTTVFSVKTDTSAIRNPHRGWVQYVYDSALFEDPVYGVKADPAWDMVSVVYSRFFWSDIEISEGVYDWSAIDEMIEYCEKYDMTFAFGIVPADSLQRKADGFVPEYVYESGCKYVDTQTPENGVQRTPVWDDEHYLEASVNLARAIAEKYDGDERIEFIDIRTFGNWGEWHTYGLTGSEMPSEAVQKKCLDEWAEAFDSTMLAMPVNDDKPTPVSEYAVELGITLRRDGLVGIKNAEYALSTAVEANLPAIGETISGYTEPRDDGTWTDEALITAVENGKLTYMALAGSVWDAHEFYADKSELLESLSSEIGYNYTVTYASLTDNGETATVKLKIRNTGSAPAYFTIDTRLALTSSTGKVSEMLPARFTIKSGSIAAGETKTLTYTFSSDLLDGGEYLAIGAFDGAYKANALPDVRFANKNSTSDGYLILGKI